MNHKRVELDNKVTVGRLCEQPTTPTTFMSLDDPRSAERIAEDDKITEERFQRDLQEFKTVEQEWKAGDGKSLTVGFRGGMCLRFSSEGYEIVDLDEADQVDYEYAQWFAAKARENGMNLVVGPRKKDQAAGEVKSMLE